ncbi:MAG TPA: Stp1/IreP family PP2C-type Ser/Thr phosphatase [Myxococcales bacterium]|jgi:serine/threonine protein phosphatase PrpC/CRP-like cAMP-binding protein|nr:Stp1/IreP family PP2C-type Ser/Thr phosphatase [Myxococcales bacterium]
MPVLRSSARTDVGRKRQHNEDAYLVDDRLGLYVVADGMGGHAAGEVASAQAIKSIRSALAEGKAVLEAFSRAPTVESREQAAALMEKAILRACADIYAMGGTDAGKRGMGTTVVALLVAGRKAVVGHVGDSRVYLYRNMRAHQLTEDHTIIQEQLKRGLITKDQVKTAENRNVITRAVGIQPQVAVDTLVTDVLPGDLFLLCTDGLHGYLHDEELPQLLAQERPKLADLLVDLALQRGGKDNITAICVAVEADDNEESTDVEGKTEILRRIPLFQHMTYKELLSILGVGRGRQFTKGQHIIREGEQGDELFVLFRGKVEVLKSGVVIAQLKAGGHFGEMGLVDQAPRSATVIASEDTSAVAIDRESLLKLMRRDSLLSVKLLWSFVQVLSERLRNTNEALTGLKLELDQVRANANQPSLDAIPKKSGPPPFGQ